METMVSRFAVWYTPIVVAVCAGIAFIPMMVGVDDKKRWVYLALLVLVTACPCALVLSTPVTVVASLAAAARQGVLIKVCFVSYNFVISALPAAFHQELLSYSTVAHVISSMIVIPSERKILLLV